MMQQQFLVMVHPVEQFKCLKISTIILGAFGMLFWGTVIAVCLSLGFYSDFATLLGSFLLAIVNAVYIFYTCRIIFFCTAATFPSPGTLLDVRKTVSRLTAVNIIGFFLFIAAIVLIATDDYYDDYYYYDSLAMLFGCSFSFLWTIVVVAVAGAHESKCSKQLASQGITPPVGVTNITPPAGVTNITPPAVQSISSMSHVNQSTSDMYPPMSAQSNSSYVN